MTNTNFWRGCMIPSFLQWASLKRNTAFRSGIELAYLSFFLFSCTYSLRLASRTYQRKAKTDGRVWMNRLYIFVQWIGEPFRLGFPTQLNNMPSIYYSSSFHSCSNAWRLSVWQGWDRVGLCLFLGFIIDLSAFAVAS